MALANMFKNQIKTKTERLTALFWFKEKYLKQ